MTNTIELGNSFKDCENLFPEGTHFERSPNGFNIYDHTGERRWSGYSFITGEGLKVLMLKLECRVAQSWHTIMGATKIWDVTTMELTTSDISVAVLYDESNPTDAVPGTSTSNKYLLYSSQTNGNLSHGWSGGYSGTRSHCVSDLARHRVLAISQSELPLQIDVESTAEKFSQIFFDGRFDTPEFVLSQPDTVTE